MRSTPTLCSRKRRPLLLLEILIAVAICALALIPLLRPHFAVLEAEKTAVRDLQFEQVADRLLIEVLQSLYENSIPWGDIQQGTAIALEAPELDGRGYEARVKLEVLKEKGSSSDGAGIHPYNLLHLQIMIYPQKEQTRAPVYSYEEKVFVHVQSTS